MDNWVLAYDFQDRLNWFLSLYSLKLKIYDHARTVAVLFLLSLITAESKKQQCRAYRDYELAACWLVGIDECKSASPACIWIRSLSLLLNEFYQIYSWIQKQYITTLMINVNW